MLLSTLTCKSVVNIRNGKCLGYINDFKIDACTGKILCLIVSEIFEGFSLKNFCRLEIPWSSICKIGEDTILVDITECPKR